MQLEPCAKCKMREGSILMRGGDFVAILCFDCADEVMQDLAPENVRGGSSVALTAEGYYRWRRSVGRPITIADAMTMVESKVRRR